MIKALHWLAGFLRNPHFIVFSLFGGMLYFSQLYAKLGYIATSAMFDGNVWLSSITAGIFGIFAGTANTALIITNRSNSQGRSLYLMGFDISISFFFYGGVCWNAFITQSPKTGAAIGAVLMGIYSSVLIYFLSEQFRQDNIRETESVALLQESEATLRDLLASWGVLVPTSCQTVPDLQALVAKAYEAQTEAYQTLAKEAALLRESQASLATARTEIENLQSVLEQGRRLQAAGKQRMQELETENQRLAALLEEASRKVKKSEDTRAISTEKGALTKFVNEQRWEEARAKQQYIHDTYGLWVEVAFPDLSKRAA